MNSPSQTTSTKCQYQATRFEREVMRRREVALHGRSQMHNSMMAPSVTWKPWKPVSMKNVEP